MKELETEFIGRGQVRGFLFTQIKRNDVAYLYKVETETSTHYEIFHRKENTQFDCVSYPSDKAFGVWAWTNDLESCLEKFEEITLKKGLVNG